MFGLKNSVHGVTFKDLNEFCITDSESATEGSDRKWGLIFICFFYLVEKNNYNY